MLGLEIVAHLYVFLLSRVFARLEIRHTRDFGVSKLCLLDFLKMRDLALCQIYTRMFHLWKSIDLESVWVGDFRSYQLSFLSQVLVHLEMRHTRVLGAGIPSNASLTFSRCCF